ncbi:MAG: transketolase family protein [Candidatus Methanomethyliales bacterium]|nr:transketolase family protein [Candidatus Methanomethylicales archaeon]
MRRAFGESLVRLGELYEELIVLTGDVGNPTYVYKFKDRYPNRLFNLGISEQDIVGVAAGLALTGRVPLVTLFSSFLMRAWEQIRNTISRANLNVKLVGTHAGLTAADDGASHQALEDLALMRVLPNMTVVAPGDPQEVKEAVEAIIEMKGPVYLRIGRDEDVRIFDRDGVFRIGKATTLMDGSDVALFSTGSITAEALEAARCTDTSVRVVHVSTIKPLDKEAVISAAKSCGAVVCVEEHSVIGGLGSAVAELLSLEYPVPVARIGIGDTFGESGTHRELLEKFGLTAEKIRSVIKGVIRRRR